MHLYRVLNSFTRQPWPLLFTITAAGLFFFTKSMGEAHAMHHYHSSLNMMDSLRHALEVTFGSNLTAVLQNWALMLAAMMPPLLAMPLVYVWRASFRSRRPPSVAVLVLGYCIAWMFVGPIITGLALFLQLAFAKFALPGVLVVALMWSASPWQRFALNRGHRVRRINPFGWAAHRDIFIFGFVHGAWCIASCWAWMLIPLVGGEWHLPIMVIAGIIMFLERLAPAGRPHWHLPIIFSQFGRYFVIGERQGVVSRG